MFTEPKIGNLMASNKLGRKQIIEKIIRHGKKQLSAKQFALLSTFINQYFSNVPLDELSNRSLEDLFGAVYSHWKLIFKHKAAEYTVHAFNPLLDKDGWESTNTIVEVIVEDMPFLVNSMRMELNRLGYSTHLVIHLGGMQLLRNSKNEVTQILPFEAENKTGLVEAPIYIEIDRQNDPEKLKEIEENLIRIVKDIKLAVSDWHNMKDRVQEAIDYLQTEHIPVDQSDVDETIAFLHWLKDDHFTFLGYRDYKLIEKGKEKTLQIVANSGLGVLRDERHSKALRHLSSLPPEARELALSNDILIISKTNTKSTLHRPVYTDYIGVKRFDKNGNISGEFRFVGLFTSDAYNSDPQDIPYFRRKVNKIMQQSGVLHHGHAAKALLNIIDTLPRDDLFQGSVEDLTDMALGIWHLQERRRIRLFVRQDAFHRYVSCLVFVPRENINTDLIARMQQTLVDAFEGHEVTYNTYFSESVLARIHYDIRINPKKRINYDIKALENTLIKVGRTWHESLQNKLIEKHGVEIGNQLAALYKRAFSAGYREVFNTRTACFDIERIEELRAGADLTMTFYRPYNAEGGSLRFKLYRFDETIPLSDALPMLENMGLRVIGEQPYEIFLEGRSLWINDFHMYHSFNDDLDVEEMKQRFQNAFYQIWKRNVGNDAFNRLVLGAGLSWRQASVLRAYAKYLRQAGFTFSQDYIEEAVNNNPELSVLLVKLFEARFDPEIKKNRTRLENDLVKEIEKSLDNVASLDEDRIIRRYMAVILATLRTNFYQLNEEGQPKSFIAFKLDPSKVPELPLPLPKLETFVYSPRVEGVHLRSSNVARGGIRWSDRREDFRVEVLGLMKAQQVKNAVIVPSGAKGGFICKKLPVDGIREDIIQEGIACYKMFISGLLDVVDNIKDNKVVTPANTVRHDDDDPYLVVAADKGTASFSDIANSISEQYNSWLGDAFASGGSVGYDHKKMGITARGAWESAKCHFREMGIDPHTQNFTAVGIGDMSGDVFGNGLLMTEHYKLVAAFNHMHIFLDPKPDTKKSYQERIRLFNMPRSSWADYNPKLISKGGAVFKRSAKSIKISPEVQVILGIDTDELVPNELIKAILRAPVDLIWNGGIGTYVKSSKETNDKVGDRANDNLRVDAKNIRAKVIAEGGNLGFTQLARVEYGLKGGHIITDFIDNSGGVDCSDREVNIKILLNSLSGKKVLSAKQRNRLLASMTDEVAGLVLANNYRQARAISYAKHQSLEYLDLYRQFMDAFEREGKLPRALEFLPNNDELNDRKANGIGLARAEIAVLMAYSKIILKEEILRSELPDDPELFPYLNSAFPEKLVKLYAKEIRHHKLRREIIATQLSNEIVTCMGITFVYQLQDETSQSPVDVVKAYLISKRIFKMTEYYREIESLDKEVPANIQFHMMRDVMRLVRRSTRWYLRNRRAGINVAKEITIASKQLPQLIDAIPRIFAGGEKDYFDNQVSHYTKAKVPLNVAKKFAISRAIYSALNILEAANKKRAKVLDVAKIYFGLMEKLDLIWFREQINAYPITNHWAVLARAAFKGDLDGILRALTLGVLSTKSKSKDDQELLNTWLQNHNELVEKWRDMVGDLRSASSNEFSMLSVAMRDLIDLSQLSLNKDMRGEIYLL